MSTLQLILPFVEAANASVNIYNTEIIELIAENALSENTQKTYKSDVEVFDRIA